jgi:DNA primase catalytic subunit
MAQYYLPKGMRYTTLNERRQFYTQEFNTQKVAEWFGNRLNHTKFAVIMGKHTKIFLPQYEEDADTTILIDDYADISEVQGQIVEFLPEAVYYDRNVYDANGQKVGQELAFDLDPENVTCPIHGSLAKKMERQQGLSFCELELDIVQKEAIGLYEFLQGRFSDLQVVYSGRGFHVHVLDKDAYALGTDKRLSLAREVRQQGFHIDEWVTTGEYRLIRLPYSLNGLVSRVVLPLKKKELESFNPISDSRCLPKFTGKATSF